jgi:hypothetical protein
VPRYPLRTDSERIWVLTVELATEVWFWTSRDVEVDGLDGAYCGVSEFPDIAERIDLRGSPSRPEVSVEVWWPEGVSVAALVAAGHRVDGSEAALAWVPVEGGVAVWSARMVVVLGTVARAEWGGEDEPAAFELRSYADDERASYPPPTWRIDSTTWPTTTVQPDIPPGLPRIDLSVTYGPRESALDNAYPIPLGRPGVLDDVTKLPTVPAYVVQETAGETDLLLVAGGTVSAAEVNIHYEVGDNEYASSGTAPTIAAVDALGQPVVLVDLSGAATAVREAGSYRTSWPEDGAVGVGAGAQGHWMLRRSSVPVDLAAGSAASAHLDSLELSGFIEEPVGPWEWVADRILGDLPACLVTTPEGGREIRPIRWRAGARDAVGHLVEGDGTVVRDRPVRGTTDGLTRHAVVMYGRDHGKDKLTQKAHDLGGSVADTSGEAGQRQVKLEADDVYSKRTADQLAAWLQWREGTSHPVVTLEVASDVWGWLQAADVVLLTEASLAIASVPHLVVEVYRSDGPWMRVVVMPTRQGA